MRKALFHALLLGSDQQFVVTPKKDVALELERVTRQVQRHQQLVEKWTYRSGPKVDAVRFRPPLPAPPLRDPYPCKKTKAQRKRGAQKRAAAKRRRGW